MQKWLSCNRAAWLRRRAITKTLLVMKLTLLFLTTALLNVSAKSFSQTITFRGFHVPLEQVFKEIKKQTDYVVVCNADLLDVAKPVTIESNNEPLKDFLDDLFRTQPLEYSITKTTIVVTEKAAPIELRPVTQKPEIKPAQAPPPTLAGRVTNTEGEPLFGASIILKKKNRGASTDVKGLFLLKDVEVGDEITVSFTGYAPQTIKVNSLKDLVITLKRSESPLDEVQVMAYGTTTQRYTTANIATVSSKQIEMQPVTNPLSALQGQVPGLVIQQQTGFANTGISVDIRGQSSLGVGSAPLYVIDGVPYFAQMLPGGEFLSLGYSGSGSSQFGAQLGNSLAYINTADIESISVLKDADATSIYGSRAAGGAILITTKKGKAGPLRVSASVTQGWQKATRFNGLMNTTQYLEMRHEAMRNSGTTPGPSDFDLNGAWDTTRNTDWQKVLLGGTGRWSDNNLNISGGNALTQYYISGTYHKETPFYINPAGVSDQKASGYMSTNTTSQNGRFNAQANMAYQFDYNQLPGYDPTGTALNMAPDAPAMYNKDGSLNWQVYNGQESFNNPIAPLLYQPTWQKTYNIVTKVRLGYKILPGLELATDAGYTNMQEDQYEATGLDAYAPTQRAYAQRVSTFIYGNQVGWNIEPQLSYHRDGRRGHLDVLGGTTFTQSEQTNRAFRAYGFISDDLMPDPTAASSIRYLNTTSDLYRYNALYGRGSYRWEDKYILSLSARHDGSSRFGPENKFHTFGSAAASWIFSSERPLKNSKILSFGKLTASYGTVGNEQIGDYQYLSTYRSYPIGTSPYQGVTGVSPNGIANPFLQWEVQRKLEGRLDLGFAHDRILFSVNYYRDRSSNQLLNYNLPNFVGFSSVTTNFPALIQNSGSEITLQTTNVKTRSFTWTTKVNVTIRRNKLVAFPNLAASSYWASLIIGQPFTGSRYYTYAGVNPQTGLFQFLSADGKDIPGSQLQNPKDAYTYINAQPLFFGGMSNTVRYKGIELDFLFQFSDGRMRNNNVPNGNYPGVGVRNQPTTVLDRWQKPGDVANFQAFETRPTGDQWTGYYNVGGTGWAIPKDYYIRLKNLSIQWQVPSAAVTKLSVKEAYIFFRAENLLTITNFQGSDPESGAFSLPVPKVMEAGIKVNL